MEQSSKEQVQDNIVDEAKINLSDSITNEENISEELEDMVEDEQTKLAALEQKVAELKELYIRSQAEIQNVQRRNIEEVKKARDYAFSSFAKDVVVVKDYLEMALADQSGNVEAIKTGVDLTLKQVTQIFERNAIKELSPNKGDKLDPHLHQAMNSIEAEGQESNTIVSVMQKGYMLNNRVLRPAMVVVAK